VSDREEQVPELPTSDLAAADHELGKLMRLGLPLMGAQLAQMLMGVLDTVMAGRLGAVDLAGVALGGNALWPVMLMLMGFCRRSRPRYLSSTVQEDRLRLARSFGKPSGLHCLVR